MLLSYSILPLDGTKGKINSCETPTFKSQWKESSFKLVHFWLFTTSLLPLWCVQVGKVNLLLAAQHRELHILLMVLSMVSCYTLWWMSYGIEALMATFGRPGLTWPAWCHLFWSSSAQFSTRLSMCSSTTRCSCRAERCPAFMSWTPHLTLLRERTTFYFSFQVVSWRETALAVHIYICRKYLFKKYELSL